MSAVLFKLIDVFEQRQDGTSLHVIYVKLSLPKIEGPLSHSTQPPSTATVQTIG